MPQATIPVDVCNRALDQCGLDEIGDLQDGSPAAKVMIRFYDDTRRQALSAAHWNFARKQNYLFLLADTAGVASPNTDVPTPWCYMYDWPVDCVHARWLPRTNLVLSQGNLIFGTGTIAGSGSIVPASVPAWSSPAPFIVASANRPNDPNSQWWMTEGHDPDQSRVVLTNQLGAQLIYTGDMQYPDAWDPLFREAFIAALAARAAMPLIPDKREARSVRQENIAIAREALAAARIRDGDEGWTVASHTPDWIRIRTTGTWWGGPGTFSYPWSYWPLVEDAGGAY